MVGRTFPEGGHDGEGCRVRNAGGREEGGGDLRVQGGDLLLLFRRVQEDVRLRTRKVHRESEELISRTTDGWIGGRRPESPEEQGGHDEGAHESSLFVHPGIGLHARGRKGVRRRRSRAYSDY